MVEEGSRGLNRKIGELEKDLKSVEATSHDLEARVRVLESLDLERLKQDMYRLESRVQSFASDHDSRKENWRMVMNFVVQLLWVSMAAWLLTKLGLQAPL